MKFLLPLLLCATTAAQLPQPSFPPISFAFPKGSGDCFAFQYNIFTTPVQRSTTYLSNHQWFWSGNWVTHETWTDSLPNGDYPVFFFLNTSPFQHLPFCHGSFLNPGYDLGFPFMAGYDRLFLLDTPIILTPTHQRTVAGVVRYQLGYHLNSTLIGRDITTQWARLDPDGFWYVGHMNGFTVNQ